MKKFIEKMKKKYPAFNFKLENKPKKSMYSIIVNLNTVGKVDIESKSIEEEKNWDMIGALIIKKTIADLQDLLEELKENPSIAIYEALKKD